MRLLADDKAVLLAAADVLDAATEGHENGWRVEMDGRDCYVQGFDYGAWFAYTGNDEGAVRYAEWIALMDPLFGRGIAELFRSEADRETFNPMTVNLAWIVLHNASSRMLEKVR